MVKPTIWAFTMADFNRIKKWDKIWEAV